jgi:hypothetical protein
VRLNRRPHIYLIGLIAEFKKVGQRTLSAKSLPIELALMVALQVLKPKESSFSELLEGDCVACEQCFSNKIDNVRIT